MGLLSIPDGEMASDLLTLSEGNHRQPLKLCFISPLGYGLYNPGAGLPFGGAEVQFFLLANTLSEDPAYQVSVLTTVNHQSGEEFRGKLRVFKRIGQHRVDPQRWHRIVPQIAGYVSAIRDMWKEFRHIDADVYLHAGAGIEVGAYALICRLLRKRFLFFIASSADLWEPYGKIEGQLKWLFPLGIRLAHAVVCRSEEQAQQLFKRYRRKGVLIRTGHPLPAFTNEPKTSILWVGRGVPLKQPEMFLDLAKQLPGHPYVMVVTTDPGHEDLIQRIRAKVRTMPNVELHENVPLGQMEQHFVHARVLVNTSTYEGFPNTFVQAAMHGAPVVSWRVNPDRLLSQETIGLCAGGSFDRLLGLVKDLCMSEEKRERLGRRARQYAYAHHDVNQSAAVLKTHVRSLVGQHLIRT